MHVRWLQIACIAGLPLAGLFACSAEVPTPEAPDSVKEDLEPPVFSDGDPSALDYYTRNLDLRGTIDFGETVAAEYGHGGFAAWIFTAGEGAEVSLDLVGQGNDPVLYLYGPQSGDSWDWRWYVARNDDHGGSLNSHIDYTVRRGGTYLALTREYWGRPGAFTLSLGCSGDECRHECGADLRCPDGSSCDQVWCIRAPCPSYCAPIDPTTACEQNSDCAEIPAGCCSCSMGGSSRAVNASYAEALTPECTIPIACPAVYLCRDEVAACVDNVCQMVDAPMGECDPGACGPALGMPNHLCDDGVTVAGPTGRCLRNEDDSCGWEVISCPEPLVGCRTSGCSGQICIAEDAPPVFTTCDWRPEYACYHDAACERQSDGACGWTMTAELTACLGG